MEISSIVTILISGGISIIAALVAWLLNRKQAKAQTEGSIAETYHKLVVDISSERDKVEKRLNEYIGRIEKNEELISSLLKKDASNTLEIQALRDDNEECKYLHEVAELEMRQIRRLSDKDSWKREKVFVLDDDEDTLNDFKHKFNRLSVLDHEGFNDVDAFMLKAKAEKPQIIILDYLLNKGMTAEDVIDGLGYMPEVFIMSGEKRFAKNFEFDRVRFFEKDENFILKFP